MVLVLVYYNNHGMYKHTPESTVTALDNYMNAFTLTHTHTPKKQ